MNKLCKKNGKKPEAFFKIVRKVTKRLLCLLRVYQHGIFVKDIEHIYEEIYGEKLEREILDWGLSSVLGMVSKFIVKKFNENRFPRFET